MFSCHQTRCVPDKGESRQQAVVNILAASLQEMKTFDIKVPDW
jgi:hypothetical protein